MDALSHTLTQAAAQADPLLSLLLAGVLVFAIGAYVILDGFDLGVGVLFPLMPDDATRDLSMASIAPIWDGNETWLILGGAVLFGAFPAAYALALPAFYLPLMLMLFALIFRGVAFEFRHKAVSRRVWDIAFSGGSTIAALCQGLLLGGLLEGVETRIGDSGAGLQFAGGTFDWLTPFSVATALGVAAGYGLLGACWLNMKSEGPQRAWARRIAQRLLLAVLAALAVVSVYTPLRFEFIAQRWFGNGHWLWLSPVPLATGLVAWRLHRTLRIGVHYPPFFWAIALFLLGYLGISVSLWPHIVPPTLDLFAASAPRPSQHFMMIALGVSLPMVLIYTVYAYWVFRGKVKAGEGYDAH